ncbi:alpha/beta hydrolase [Paenibacillaceae bacterium WGS1546]|uniref:alpha/beta hydrolase n=1 Tax=Cohnella sp. WGS1546 TaxID=3366810 RepID=UPI00372D729C
MSDNPMYKRTIHKHEVESRHLAEGVRSVRVYLPPDYQAWRSYPVVYCQDGEQFFNFGRIATHAQRLILEDGWEPFVVVGVDVDNAQRTSEYTPDGERYLSYTRFFAEELISWIESRYSVRDVPEHRVLAGDSLGGAVSVSLALAYPELFRNVISLSGAFYDVYLDQIRQADSLADRKLWMIVGLQEKEFATDRGTFDFVQLNRDAVRLLKEKGASVRYEEKDGEHKWGFWQNELPAALAEFLGPASRKRD